MATSLITTACPKNESKSVSLFSLEKSVGDFSAVPNILWIACTRASRKVFEPGLLEVSRKINVALFFYFKLNYKNFK